LRLPVLSGQLRGLFNLRRDNLHCPERSFFWGAVRLRRQFATPLSRFRTGAKKQPITVDYVTKLKTS